MIKFQPYSTICAFIAIAATLGACVAPRTSAAVGAPAMPMSCMAGQERQCRMMSDMASGMGTVRDHMAQMQDMMQACTAAGKPCDHGKMMADMQAMQQRMQDMMGEMKAMNGMMGKGMKGDTKINMAEMKDQMSKLQGMMKTCHQMMEACATGQPCAKDIMMNDMSSMHNMMGMMMQRMKAMSQKQASPPAQRGDHAAHQHDAPK